MGLQARPDAPRLAAIALVDIAPWMEPQGVGRIVDFMRAYPDGFASLEEVSRHIAGYRGQTLAAIPAGLRKNLRLNGHGRWVWHWDPRLMSGENHDHRNDPAFFERALACYPGPLLLVRGARSDVVSEESVSRFTKMFPRARVTQLTGAGHMVAGDANTAFTSTVIEFLAEVMPTDGTPTQQLDK